MGRASQAGNLLLASLIVLAPIAAAHGGFDTGAPLGEASLHLRILGAPVLAAGTPLRMEVATDAARPVEARLIAPSGETGAWFTLDDEGDVHSRDIAFDAAGEWRVEIRAGEHVADLAVPVWPAGRAFFEPAGEAASRGVVVAGSREPLFLRLVNADHAPIETPADARVVLSGPQGREEVAAQTRDGLVVIERAWDETGAHQVEVVSDSLRLGEGARPPVAVLVVSPEEASVYGLESREVPAGALAIPAILLALLAASRITRARP